MRVLADTSVWVDYLRDGVSGRGGALDGLLASGDVAMCGPVAAELIAGAQDDVRATLWQHVSSLPWAEIGRSEWRRVGEVAAALRRTGTSVALTDIEIAVAAAEAGVELWSRDSDFERIGSAVPELRRFEPNPS